MVFSRIMPCLSLSSLCLSSLTVIYLNLPNLTLPCLAQGAQNAQGSRFYRPGKSLADQARELHESGKTKEAIQMLDAAIARAPKAFATGALYRTRADLWCAEHNLQKGLDDFNLALAVEKRPKTYTSRGAIYQAMGRRKEAEADYLRAIKDDNGGGAAYSYLARFYMQDGQFQKAINVATEEMKRRGADETTLRFRAGIEMKAAKYKEALKDYQEAARVAPMNFLNTQGIGDAFFALKDFNGALNAYTKSLDLEPISVEDLYLKRAKVYDALGKPELARKDREKAK